MAQAELSKLDNYLVTNIDSLKYEFIQKRKKIDLERKKRQDWKLFSSNDWFLLDCNYRVG